MSGEQAYIKEQQRHTASVVPAASYASRNVFQLVDRRKKSGAEAAMERGYLQDNRKEQVLQRKTNTTGLPDSLKSGIENLSGHSMDDVKVHYNSSKPAQLQAHAYAQGREIHLAAGQEKHLPHEAWHVIQQKQGRVKPTVQLKGKFINDNRALEKEADEMGAKAIQFSKSGGKFRHSEYAFWKSDLRPEEEEKNIQRVPLYPGVAIVQRRIDYTTTSARLGEVTNRDQLVAALEAKFAHLSGIGTMVDQIESALARWTVSDVYNAVSKKASTVAIPFLGMQQSDEIQMPSRLAFAKDFGFTTRTRARGSVGGHPIRDATQKSTRFHAEDDLMAHLDELLSQKSITGTETIRITINNSPCLGRCAPNLVAWFRRFWSHGRMIIRYANPYGTQDEFVRAKAMLRAAGITVKSFPAERFVDMNSLSVKQRGRFMKMMQRRRAYRRYWNKKHPDDQSDESDAGEMFSPSMGMSKGKTSGHAASSMEPIDEEMAGPPLVVHGEAGVSAEIVKSVVDFLRDSHFNPGGPLLVVSGAHWTCYVRCVLYHLGEMGKYDAVMHEIGEAHIDINSGVEVGSDEEVTIIGIITRLTGKAYYVRAVDAAHGHPAQSRHVAGTRVNIVLTGAHFSLLQ